MKRVLLLALVVSAAATTLLVTAGGASSAQSAHKFKFEPTVNAPWANEGDEEGFEPADAAAGLCRSAPFNTPGAYAPTTDVDVIVGDATNNSGFSNFGCRTPQNETSIAVNPANPSNIIAGANDYRVCCDFTGLNDATAWAYFSKDGGTTWGNVQAPGLTAETGASGQLKKFDSAGDPVVAFGPDGTAYYANIAFSRVSPVSGIIMSVSRDGGATWSQPNVVTYTDSGNFLHDKVWMAPGPNGKVVVTWTRFNLGPHGAGYRESPIVGAFSKDFGQTWNRQSFPISDAAHPFDQGSQVAWGPDGALYVAYEASSPTTNFATDAMVIARSTDDGQTFETKELSRVFDDLDCYPFFAGRQTLTDMHFRLNSYPSLSVDPMTGGISLVWTDEEHAGNCGTGGTSFSGTTSNQVKLLQGTWATIGGASPTTITTTPADKVFPSVASSHGKTVVTYYARDYAATHNPAVCNFQTNPNPTQIPPVPIGHSVCLDYAAKTSTDGFTTQRRLTSEGSNPFVQFADGAFIGDYSQVALNSSASKAYGAWTDFRGKPGITPANQDVMVGAFNP